MTIVNLFSEYIKKIADETDTDYADVIKSFEKSNRLQKDWKAYRDAELKKKPYLFTPPVIEKVIYIQDVEPISSITIPTPTTDTTIQVDKDSNNSVLITELEKEGIEETKEEEPPSTITIKKKTKIKKSPKKIEIEGEGVEDYLPVRRNYPPKSRQVLFNYGREKIRDMKIVRTELSPVVFNTINFITEYTSRGKFQERFKKMPYDKLYHLALIVTTQEGSVIKIEKNEVLNVELNPTISPNAEIKQITNNVPRDLSIANMLYKAQSRMGGDRFFTYNAVRNNCQDFLLNILDANKIGDESDRQFIKQDVGALFKGFEGTENFLSLLTSIASIANRLIYGNGIEGKAVADKDYVVQTIIFNKSKWDTEKASKWLRENKYKNKGVDKKENSLRFRQINPDYIERKGFNKYATKPLGKSGISIVLAYKKNK